MSSIDARVRLQRTGCVATEAIVIYRSNSYMGSMRHEKVAYALIHPILKSESGFQLGAGHPLKMESLSESLIDLAEGNGVGSGFLPACVLAHSAIHIAWWVPPREQKLFFRPDGEDQAVVTVSTPGLVFRATRGDLSILAVKGNERPTADQHCFENPFFNVWKGGRMCQGNVEYPEGVVTEKIKAWERSFFDSSFTHTNANEAVQYRGGMVGLWNDISKGVISSIPEIALTPVRSKTTGQTLTVADFVS